MTITIVASPAFQGPDENGVTWVHLKLSRTPSQAWIDAFDRAASAVPATGRPPQYDVENDEVIFGFNASAEPEDGDDHEMLRYLDVVRGWIAQANADEPGG